MKNKSVAYTNGHEQGTKDALEFAPYRPVQRKSIKLFFQMLLRPSIVADYKAGYIQGFMTIANARKLKKATRTVNEHDKNLREKQLQKIKEKSQEKGRGR